jgi:hypothetical protein
MKRLPLISMTLLATLGVACSSPSDSSAPEAVEQVAPRKQVSQALSTVTLVEVPVSAAVQAAAGSEATVRAFEIQAAPGASFTVADVMPVALQQGASDLSKDWKVLPERNKEETREALRYLESLVPAIEAELGASVEYSSGYYHSWEAAGFELCHHRDFYGVVAGDKVFTIEGSGNVGC